MLYVPDMRMLAFVSRANFNDVARLGSVVSGIRSFCWTNLRWSLEIMLRFGTRSSSDSERAKLSPTQLNSGLSDVFSNGRTITVSTAFWADAWIIETRMMNIRMADFLNIALEMKNSLEKKRIGSERFDAKTE